MDRLKSFNTKLQSNTTVMKSKEVVDKVYRKTRNFLSSGTIFSRIILAVLFIAVFIVVVNIIRKGYSMYQNMANSSPWIFKGTKDAKSRMVVIQDPSKYGAVTLPKSKNEYGGLEFTYMTWIHVDNWGYQQGKWKHILHKGNSNGPNNQVDGGENNEGPGGPLLQAPGIWLHKDENTLRINMNTYENVREFVDIENIPLNKWVHLTVAVRQRHMDIFINGNLVKRHELEGLPKQNSGDVYINSFKGFGGYVSNVKYFNYYASFRDIDENIKMGPSQKPCADSGERPPYFVANWWLSQ